jgi:hypothetical protein
METTTQRGALCSVFLAKYNSGDQTKKKQMGSACASWVVVGKPKGGRSGLE